MADKFNRGRANTQQSNVTKLHNYGWVMTTWNSENSPTIYFGRRDVMTVDNIIRASYIFNTKLSLSLRVRHYWSQVRYLDYYTLGTDGYLTEVNYWQNHNINFNIFSADLQFIWYFAPGSELSVVWKNFISTLDNKLVHEYIENFRQTLRTVTTRVPR